MGDVIHVVTPVALLDVINSIGPEFEVATGHRLDLSVMLNPEVPSFIQSGAPWSLAASNPWHLEEISKEARGPIRALGRSPLAFGSLGKDRPVAKDPARVADVLRSATRIGVTGAGSSGETFARLLDRLKIGTEIRERVIPLGGGEPMQRLLSGEIDLAVLPLTNIAPIPGVCAVAVCPWDLGVHIDLALCCHPEAPAGARDFAEWLISRDRNADLEALGLMRS